MTAEPRGMALPFRIGREGALLETVRGQGYRLCSSR